MTLPNRSDRASWILGSQSTSEVREKYDQWAEDYDADLAVYGYRTPAVGAGLVGRFIPKGATPILDAGAGTGNMGMVLKYLGYPDVTAADLSEGMLKVASRTGAYTATKQITLGEHLDFPDNHFAAIICLGTFAGGHAPPESFDEMLRIAKPGSRMIFTVRHDVIERFKPVMAAHEQAGRWQLLDTAGPFVTIPDSGEPDTPSTMFAYEVS